MSRERPTSSPPKCGRTPYLVGGPAALGLTQQTAEEDLVDPAAKSLLTVDYDNWNTIGKLGSQLRVGVDID